MTNYLTQTILGIIVLRGIFDQGELGRAAIFVFVLAVWTAQLLWSREAPQPLE